MSGLILLSSIIFQGSPGGACIFIDWASSLDPISRWAPSQSMSCTLLTSYLFQEASPTTLGHANSFIHSSIHPFIHSFIHSLNLLSTFGIPCTVGSGHVFMTPLSSRLLHTHLCSLCSHKGAEMASKIRCQPDILLQKMGKKINGEFIIVCSALLSIFSKERNSILMRG